MKTAETSLYYHPLILENFRNSLIQKKMINFTFYYNFMITLMLENNNNEDIHSI